MPEKMRKLPGWISVEAIEKGKDGLRVWIRPRRWHPGYWVFWFQRLLLWVGRRLTGRARRPNP